MTPKQERFVQEYLIDLNATRAAIRAGYSAKTAEQQGPRLLGNVGVAAAIAKAQAERAAKVELTQEFVISGLVKEATREDDDSSHAARVSAYGLLGKHMGMFVSKTELSGALEVTKIVREIVYPPGKGPVDE